MAGAGGGNGGVGRKIIDTVRAVQEQGGTTISLEFFPAKTEEGVSNLLARIEDMTYRLQPTFVTLTWRAAFKDESLWLKIGATVQASGVDILMHLTCHLPKADLVRVLKNARAAGIRNILALRGDPPIGEDTWQRTPGGFANAVELVRLIREEHADYFCIAVAAYPEVHTECWNNPELPPSEQAMALDLKRLKEKVDAGADLVITQFFYDVDRFEAFAAKCREVGIPASVPILPGYLPIQNYKSFTKFTQWCKTAVPAHITSALERIKDDDERVKAFGVEEGIRVSQRLLQAGHKTLHYYSMNLAEAVTSIIEGLGLLPKPNLRELSWQRHMAAGAHLGGRAQDEVRPIFWANRPASYTNRTHNWDEFPNGRWGDSRSPAYGELSHYYLEFKRPKVDRQALWGVPARPEDVYDVFVRFLDGAVASLPWCEQAPAPETTAISSSLKLLNANGYLTINSQPAVNGRPSTDPEVGWGGRGGYVYQKAYVEFFCSAAKLKLLLEELPRHKNLSYHAMNSKGEEYTNNNSAAGPGRVTAVTWGVFPGREVVQPTVVDAASFAAWKDEAFELWLSQWATAYEEGSAARKVIEDIHGTFFLVNIVDNDYTGEGFGAGAEEAGAGAEEEGRGQDLFSLFRSVILKSMGPVELQAFTVETQRESDYLKSIIKDLKSVNVGLAHEMKLLREALVVSQKEMGTLKQQVSALKLQRGYDQLAAGGNGGALASARAALKPSSSAATPALGGAVATPAAAAFFPTA